MDPYQLVVGDKDCPYKTVVAFARQSSAIQKEWSTFARQLDVSSERIKKFRKDLLDNITYGDLIFEVLEIWRAANAGKATLANLLQVIEGDCGANDVGELLRLEYKLPCKRKRSDSGDNTIGWEDLSPAFKKRVTETLQHFTPNLKFAKVLPKLTGSALICLMRGKKPHVLSLPEELSYYVSRTVVTRNIISDNIFEQNSSDIFLFTGMERNDLSRLATKRNLTSSSRQQLQGGVSVKFMILDQENHFERICAKTHHPAHWLRKEGDEKMRWMKTKGEMDNLWKCIDKEQDKLVEELFCQMCTSRSHPVLICDSPGMGKSVLLAQIGHRLVQLHPERTILFIVLSKFIEFAKSIKIEDKVKVIELTLQNWTGVPLQKTNLDSDEETNSIELLLDGFDEVDSADRKLALEILQTFSKSFKCIRLWITSRPHFMDELENSLNVLGYNILPFHEEDQIQFLSSFWSRKRLTQLDQEKLKLFAKKCLKSLKVTMKNSTDNDIAGIPLQCLLIGEVYEDDAVEYAKTDKEIGSCAAIEIEIGAITDLYSQLIEKKLEKYKSAFGITKLKDDDLMTIYTHLSLEKLFPVEHGVLGLTKAAEIDMDEVVKGGILTSARMGGVAFIHRTFTEYFVAWFVIERLQQNEDWTPEQLNLFFTIMSCSIYPEFSHPVISYFLDFMLFNIQLETLPSKFPPKLTDKQLELVTDITRACVGCNFVQIFKLFDTRDVFDMLPANVFNVDLLLFGVRKSNVELVKLVLARFERHHNFNLDVQKATLREAVKHGKFSTLEFLIKEKRLGEILEHFEEDTNLVSDCVKETAHCSDETINERIQVIQMLVDVKGSLVDGLNLIGYSITAPLLSDRVHVKLLIELIRLRANVAVKNLRGRTVLHLDYRASREDYHNLVMSIPTDNLKKIINFKESATFFDTALARILKWFDPLPETLDRFHGVGADFNPVNRTGHSILGVAIQKGRNAETIRKLIQLGARVEIQLLRSFRTTNLLHLATKNGNVDAVEVLLDECKIHVNSMDDNGRTPLDHAIDNILSSTSSDKRKKFSVHAKVLIERGGELKKLAKAKKFMGEPLLDVVATNNLESVKLLVQLGLYKVTECERSSLSFGDRYSIIQNLLENGSNPSALDNRNETLFHAFLRNKKVHDFKIFQLIKSKWDESSLWTPAVATLALEYAVGGEDAFPDENFVFLAQECETHGADFNWRNDFGKSLLHLAASNGKASTVKILIKKGVNTNLKTNGEESPLSMAAESNQSTSMEVIKCLLENGVNPMETRKNKMNILHSAALGTVHALKHFLELGGADVNGQDSLYGDTPLHCAVASSENQSADIDSLEKCKLLIQHGADVNITNMFGDTPMKSAMESQPKNTPLIELLSISEGAIHL